MPANNKQLRRHVGCELMENFVILYFVSSSVAMSCEDMCRTKTIEITTKKIVNGHK